LNYDRVLEDRSQLLSVDKHARTRGALRGATLSKVRFVDNSCGWC
jgi:hypothetical protein